MDYENILNDKKKRAILARIVAHLMGDGCVTKKYFAYYNKNQTLIENFEKDINLIFTGNHIAKGKVNSGTSFRMVMNKEINDFLMTLIPDYRSFSLYWPHFVNTREMKIEFLRAFYDDEGCVALRVFKRTNEIKRNVTLSSNSKRLLNEVKEILLNDFDINTNKLQKNLRKRDGKIFTNYVLSITGRSNFQRFQKDISFTHPQKREKLNNMINSYIRLAATI